MFKKAFKKLVGSSKKSKSSASASPSKPSKASTPRILTAEGWKRLMMKKYRKSK
jgi:cellulase/cellobiase CelA1